METARSAAGDAVESMFAGMRAGDLEAMMASVHPDVEVIEADSVPFYPGTYSGKDKFIEDVIGPMMSHYEVEIYTLTDGLISRIDVFYKDTAAMRELVQ